MKKIFCSIAILTLALSASFATAQLTATSRAVVLKAIVPEYIGLTAVNPADVVFDFGLISDTAKEQFSRGAKLENFTAANAPTWEMVYNLTHRSVTVCAYASDLINGGEANSKIISALVLGRSVQISGNGGQGSWFGMNNACKAGMGTGAVLLDTFTGATSSFNTEPTHVRPEGFNLMQITGNPGNDWQVPLAVPAPGVYLGTMYVVAQAI